MQHILGLLVLNNLLGKLCALQSTQNDLQLNVCSENQTYAIHYMLQDNIEMMRIMVYRQNKKFIVVSDYQNSASRRAFLPGNIRNNKIERIPQPDTAGNVAIVTLTIEESPTTTIDPLPTSIDSCTFTGTRIVKQKEQGKTVTKSMVYYKYCKTTPKKRKVITIINGHPKTVYIETDRVNSQPHIILHNEGLKKRNNFMLNLAISLSTFLLKL